MKLEWDRQSSGFAANILVKHINSVQAEMDGIRINKDIEHIHRMRVASRRLRNALQIFGFIISDKKQARWSGSIKKITSSLGEARDRDVQIILVEKLLAEADDRKLVPGLKRIILRLKQARAHLQADVVLAMDGLTSTSVLEEMKTYLSPDPIGEDDQQTFSQALYRLSWQTLLPQLQLFLSYEPYINDPANSKELHAMRIAAKKMRYSMELFAPLYFDKLQPFLLAVRQTQEMLGNIHDSFVWEQYLSGFVKRETKRAIEFYGIPRGITALRPGVNYLTQYQVNFSRAEHQAFLNSWQEWEKANLWQELVNLLKNPLL